jgi:DNA-binding NtrC family response regulator
VPRTAREVRHDLDAEVAAGRFREDLSFRIREITIALPPLRERGTLEALAALWVLRETERQLGLGRHALSTAAERRLMSHPWPGNARELRTVMRRAAVLCDGSVIGPRHLGLAPPRSAAPAGAQAADAPPLPGDRGERPLAQARDEFVRRYVMDAVARHGGSRRQAAVALGISVRSLHRYLRRGL